MVELLLFVQMMIPWSLRVGGRSRSWVEDVITVAALLTEFIRNMMLLINTVLKSPRLLFVQHFVPSRKIIETSATTAVQRQYFSYN